MRADAVHPEAGSRNAAWLGAAGVGLGILALSLPRVLAGWVLTPDAIEYLGVAQSFVHGRGWVDPVQYSYYLEGAAAPVPALAIRAPLLSLLLAGPLALGASLATLGRLHVLYAAAIGAGGVLLARRRIGLPAALGFGVALGWSYSWVLASQQLLTEATAVGLLLATAAWLPRGLGTAPDGSARDRDRPVGAGAALALGGLLLLGWLARPNLALAVPAVALAALVQRGVRDTLRSRPLWIALGSFAAGYALVHALSFATSGWAPYANYAAALENVGTAEAASFHKQYVGAFAFFAENPTRYLNVLTWNSAGVLRTLCLTPDFHYAGWIALPAFAYGLLRGGPGALERRFFAFAGLGLLALALASYGAHDPRRLPLLAVACIWWLGAALLDDVFQRVSAGRTRARTALRWAPLWLPLAVFLFSPSATGIGRWSWEYFERWRIHGTQPSSGRWDRAAQALCGHIDRDARVASPDPWALYLWCGNAGIILPRDLRDKEDVDRYLDATAPAYLVADSSPAFRVLARSSRLERIATGGSDALYRVRDPGPRSHPWQAPPALAAQRKAQPK